MNNIWSDSHTNTRGRELEECIIKRDVLLLNVDSNVPTFESNKGYSWIDLTLCNSTLALKIRSWTCGEEVSCADHNIIFFEIDSGTNGQWPKQYTAKGYITKAEKWESFSHNLAKKLIEKFHCPEDIRKWSARENEISQKIKLYPDTDRVMQKFTSAITAACYTTVQV